VGNLREKLNGVINWDVPSHPVAELSEKSYPLERGWYKRENSNWVGCEAPSDRVLFVDTEAVLYNGHRTPLCCSAYDGSQWFIWVNSQHTHSARVPDGHNNLYIAHNASYDRSLFSSAYRPETDSNNWFCTMSAITAVRGMSNQQRAMYLSKNEFAHQGWETEATLVSLAASLEFYTSEKLDKGFSKDIWKEGLPIWFTNAADVVHYCCSDIIYTVKLARYLLPEFFYSVPSLTSLSGYFLMSSEFVILRKSWINFHSKIERAYSLASGRVSQELEKLVINSTENGFNRHLDWTADKKGKINWKKKFSSKLATAKKDHKGASINWRECVSMLCLTYLKHPITWHDDAWQYDSSIELEEMREFVIDEDKLVCLPHPDKRGMKLTQLLIKSTVALFDGCISSLATDCKPLLKDILSITNWTSLRTRVGDVDASKYDTETLIHIPQETVYGTITRRKGGKLFPVAPNPKAYKMGTELKSYLTAPTGYKLVKCDFDSQEAVVFALLGDSKEGFVGGTPLSVTVNIGQKATETDIHSMQAKATGMSRELAKALVYAGFYGQGLKSATQHILRGSPNISPSEANRLAKNFHTSLKGEKFNGLFRGGLASSSYNTVSRIADSKEPRTPMLKSRIPLSLDTAEFKPTRDNWVIQSTGRDLLDTLVTLITYGIHCEGIDAKLSYTCHDECIYICAEADTRKLAEVIMHCHLLTYACLVEALGLDTVPCCRMYPEAIEVDTIWRKTVNTSCKTPTQGKFKVDGVALSILDFKPSANSN